MGEPTAGGEREPSRPAAPEPASRSGLRIARVVALLGILAAAISVGARRLADPDLPWHLAVGRAMVALHALPRADDFSYPFRGVTYPSEYLGELLLWVTLRAGGAVGLQGLCVLCVLAVAGLMLARARGTGAVGAGLVALAIGASEIWWVMRPAMLSFVLLASALWLIERHRERGGWSLLWLVPLQWAWSAVHGFASLGAAMALGYALYALGCRAARGRGGVIAALLPARDGDGALVALVTSPAALLATCLGPVGPRLFLAPHKALEYAGYLTEWAPVTPRFVLLHAPAFGLLAALALAALLMGRAQLPSLFDLALLLGPLALALARARLVPLFCIAATPVIARRLAPLLGRARLGPLLLAVAGLAAAPLVLLSPGSHLGLGFDADRLPERATRFAESHRLRGPLWNFLSFGGWIEFRLYPEVRTFIDGRTSYLVPFDFFHDYVLAEHDPARFAALDSRWHFQWAMVPAGPLDHFAEPIAADPRWALVHLDEVAAIYVRADGENRDLAAAGYQVLRHDTALAALLSVPSVSAGALAHDAALAISEQPDSPRAHLLASVAALLRNDREQAVRERDVAEAIDPRYPGLAELDARLATP